MIFGNHSLPISFSINQVMSMKGTILSDVVSALHLKHNDKIEWFSE